MNINQIHSAFFIGIGGIGMSAIAKYFNAIGIKVFGYDLVRTELTQQLENRGIQIFYEDNTEFLVEFNKEKTLVIYTPAIPKENKIYNFFLNNNFECYKRSRVLGLITKDKYCIGVAGTHGKTTTSSMLAYLLDKSSIKTNAFLGGIATDYQTNLISNPDSENVVVEADEFDRSFLALAPNISILTSVDPDHLDIYQDSNQFQESFQEYIDLLPKNGLLVKHEGVALNSNTKTITYGFNEKADVCIKDIRVLKGNFVFSLIGLVTIENITTTLPGRHNILNLTAAIIVADRLGVTHKEIKQLSSSFKGIKRRFEYKLKEDEHIVIEDYAHHPTELDACIAATKELYPNKKVSGIFQPHLFSRTKDFMNEFAVSLSKLDEIFLLDIFPAREKPIKDITSKALLDKIKTKNKKLIPYQKAVETIKNSNPEVLLIMGAGDIGNLSSPISKALKN